MLVWLASYLETFYSGFNVFHYVTVRAILAVLTALMIALLLGPWLIRRLTALKVGQVIRDDGPQSHLSKSGTPTMGGLLMIIAISTATLLWADLTNPYVWIALLGMLGFAVIGGVDDYRKLVLKNSKGLPSRWKYFWQSVIAITLIVLLYNMATLPSQTQLVVPFVKSIALDLGLAYMILGYFVIVGASNAVNLTDGLDGLAILPTVLVAAALSVFAYVAGHAEFARYLGVPYVPLTAETVIFCASIVGAGLGFLWFNTYPAQVFMGDVGSLSLGAALGLIAIMVRQEFVLFIMGGIFVLETVSVMLQVASFKLTGKRIFKMAPIHHHFELKGWPEPRVIVRFWIITVVLVLIGLATLKVR